MKYDETVTHVAMISGGKDSTAMAINLVEAGWQVEEWIFCDTGKEFPQMYEHLDRLERYLGITLTRLVPERGFDYWMSQHVKTKGARKGEVGYGWPMPHRWCTKQLKQWETKKYLKRYQNVIEYQGIAVDEAERALKNNDKIVHYPLLFWGMTEAACLQFCYDRGFDWGGLYEDFDRVSCWCCPHSSIPELRTLYRKYPHLWGKMRRMNGGKDWLFKSGKTFAEWEARFAEELEEVE